MAALAQQQANKALSQAHGNASNALGAFDLGFSRIYAGKPMDGISNAYDLYMHGPAGRTIDPYYLGETTQLPQPLPPSAFNCRFFVNDWNSFIHVAALDAKIELT